MASAIGNFFIKAILRSPLHALLGPSFAVITVKGRKTGKFYSTPINVAPQGGSYTVVSMRSRIWWRNLRDGQAAELKLAGKCLPVTGAILENPPEVAEALAAHQG